MKDIFLKQIYESHWFLAVTAVILLSDTLAVKRGRSGPCYRPAQNMLGMTAHEMCDTYALTLFLFFIS